MNIKLHANARTTPKTRALIQSSPLSVVELARQLGVSETTVRRWRGRKRVTDGSHVPHRLQVSTTATEEALIVELRTAVGLSLDDLTGVMRRCVNPSLSRSAIHRCLMRHGVSRRPTSERAETKVFASEPCGVIHMDLKHLPRLERRASYVFVAIDRATRFVHIEIIERRAAANLAGCLERFLAAFPYPVRTVLSDNGSEFTDRFAVDKKGKPFDRPSGDHAFDKLCEERGIEHRLIRPYRPQTNGMVERFNRRLAEAIRNAPDAATNAGKNKFTSHAERNAFIHRVADDYNRTRLRCLDFKSPKQMLDNLLGHNTKAGVWSHVSSATLLMISENTSFGVL